MGYKEELFSRIELAGLTTKSEIQSWLAGPNRNLNSYRNIAVQLQEPIAIRLATERSNDLNEVERLYQDSLSMEVEDRKTVNITKNKFEKLQREEVERQEQELVREIAEREALKERIKEAEKVEDIKQARKELRELSPKSYGGIKSGETRKALSSFRELMG
jgi:hypothetical protein